MQEKRQTLFVVGSTLLLSILAGSSPALAADMLVQNLTVCKQGSDLGVWFEAQYLADLDDEDETTTTLRVTVVGTGDVVVDDRLVTWDKPGPLATCGAGAPLYGPDGRRCARCGCIDGAFHRRSARGPDDPGA